MYPPPFGYLRAESVAQTVEWLARYGDQARPLAGGQSLLPLLKQRLLAPKLLIDLAGIADLGYLEARPQEGVLALGAMVRHRAVERWAAQAPAGLAALGDAAGVIADVQVRNRGTVAGDLAHADPGGDWAPVMVALNAHVTVHGPRGSRRLAVAELVQGPYATALAPDEVVTQVAVPWPPAGSGSAYLAFKRRAGDYAVASAAAWARVDAEGRLQEARVVLGSVGPTPLVVTEAPAAALADDWAGLEALAAAAADPWEDLRGSVRYKRALAGTLARRALGQALARARTERASPTHP